MSERRHAVGKIQTGSKLWVGRDRELGKLPRCATGLLYTRLRVVSLYVG